MDLGLNNKVALVLAGGGGIGRASSLSLAREGATVIVAGRSAGSIQETIDEVLAAGGSAMPILWDLSQAEMVDESISKIERDVGSIDVLVNITGGPPPTVVAEQSSELWLNNFNAMVMSVISITDRVLPAMRSKKWGRIITNTSSGVVSPIPNLGLSNTLRSALLGWSKTLAKEIACDGITTNIMVPGRIATKRLNILDKARAKREEKPLERVESESIATIPAGRYGRPEEYADVITFLASERASYITGSVIRVDGGMITSI